MILNISLKVKLGQQESAIKGRVTIPDLDDVRSDVSDVRSDVRPEFRF